MRGRRVRGWAGTLALALPAALAGCGGPDPGPDPRATAATEQPVAPPIAAFDAAGDVFVDETATAGIGFVHDLVDGRMDNIVESVGSGASWIDYDGDGDLDLYLVDFAWDEDISGCPRPARRPTNRLYRNLGDGRFEDVTDTSGTGDAGFGFAAAVADYDNDGDSDLYVLNRGPNRLYRNLGAGRFEDVTASAGVGCDACSVAGTFFDADGDGFLDLYVGNYLRFDPEYRTHYAPDAFPGPLAFAAEADVLYLNNGDGTFRDATREAGLDVAPARSMGVAAADFDGDGRTDLFVANDASANYLFHNEGEGRFAEMGLMAGVAYGVHGEATGAMAGFVGDMDGDGLPDLSVTDTAYGSLYWNRGDCQFLDQVVAAGVAAPSGQRVSWGGGFLDYDNDGDLDLYLANGDLHHPTGRPDLLLRNDGRAHFEDVSGEAGACFRAELLSRGGLIGDYDDDGDLDLVITNLGDRPVLLRNNVGQARHWIGFRLRGTRSPRDAFGARVAVTTAGRRLVREHQDPTGYLAHGDPRIHFGLGDLDRVERVEVSWPSGLRQEFTQVAAGRYYELVEGEELR